MQLRLLTEAKNGNQGPDFSNPKLLEVLSKWTTPRFTLEAQNAIASAVMESEIQHFEPFRNTMATLREAVKTAI